MYASISASQWGSPTAPRKALLIHGLTACSSSWEGVAQLLAAEGFFVVAPNLLGHAWRRGTDYRVSTLVEDLQPYLIKDTFYDVIVGHSLGGTVALSLLHFLPKTKQTNVILLDPPLEIERTLEMHKRWFLNEVTNVRTTQELADDFGWSRRNCMLHALGVSMCDTTTIEGVFSHNRPWSFSGLLRGLASCIAPLYIQELSPTRMRGRMVVLNVVMITFGQVVAYGIDAGFANVNGGWRWMVGLGTVPAGIQLICLAFLPESPRILIQKGNIEAAHRVLERVYSQATAEQIDFQLQVLRTSVQQSIDIANSTTFFERCNSMITVPVNRRALIIGCGMQAFQQLCGFNTLMYYSASLFQEIGFNQPTAVGLIVSGTNFIFTLFALKYIDIVGRRRIMVFSAPGMVFGLTLASIAFHYMTLHTGGDLVNGVSYSRSWSAIVLLSMIIFVASYATGLGNVPWQQGELFGLEVRGIGTSLSTATNWAGNLLIGSTYLSLMAKITPAGAFGFYAGLCLLGWLFCLFCFPETAGLSLEEVQSIFRDGFGIRESQRMRNQKREMRMQQDIKAGRGNA